MAVKGNSKNFLDTFFVVIYRIQKYETNACSSFLRSQNEFYGIQRWILMD